MLRAAPVIPSPPKCFPLIGTCQQGDPPRDLHKSRRAARGTPGCRRQVLGGTGHSRRRSGPGGTSRRLGCKVLPNHHLIGAHQRSACPPSLITDDGSSRLGQNHSRTKAALGGFSGSYLSDREPLISASAVSVLQEILLPSSSGFAGRSSPDASPV